VVTRRSFVLSSVALSAGCVWRRARPDPTGAKLRPPAVGQSWRYAKRNGFSGKLIDDQVDQVAEVGDTVRIDSRSEAGAASTRKSWGKVWLEKYVGNPSPPGPLPSEVQQPWGHVLVDAHWPQVQVYEKAIPLWPRPLASGASAHYNTEYKTPDHQSGLPWDQTMSAHGWESVTVPAGRFTALRYTNLINFSDTDASRVSCVRKETLWFAPEVGRWIARESAGTYYLDDSVDDTLYEESSFRWELVSYT
jgi:hypothetical protein